MTPTDLLAKIQMHEAALVALARDMAPMVPANVNAPMAEAQRALFSAAGLCQQARRGVQTAIKEAMG